MISRFNKMQYLIVPISWSSIIFFITPEFGKYSPDSFAYYLLGNNFFSGLGYTSQTIRDFYISPELLPSSRSFPPIMPLLIGLVSKITGWGIVTGTIINLGILYATLHYWYLLSKQIFGKFLYVAFFCFIYFVFNNAPYVGEIVAGRSAPLVMLLLFLLMYFTTRIESGTNKVMAAIGIVLALLPLTRFDALPFSMSVLMLYSFWLRKERRGLITLLLSFVLVMAPWMIRNMVAFGNPFASDNSVTAFSTHAGIVQLSIFEGGIPLVSHNPQLWFDQRLGYVNENVKLIMSSLSPMSGWLVVSLLLMSVCLIQRDEARMTFNALKKDSESTMHRVKVIFLIGWLWVLTNIASVSLTSYRDERYFLVSVFILLSLATSSVIILFMNNNANSISNVTSPSSRVSPRSRFLLVTSIALLLVTPAVIQVKQALMAKTDTLLRPRALSGLYAEFAPLIKEGSLVADGDAENMAYQTGWRTIYLPINLREVSGETFFSWIKKWKVDYVLMGGESILQQNPSAILLKSVGDARLYDVRGMEANFPDATPSFYLTDSNWERGISRNFSGFFVPNTPDYSNAYVPGKVVRFKNGESVTILRTQPMGQYLHVFVSGGLLNAFRVGIPSEFTLSDKSVDVKKGGAQ